MSKKEGLNMNNPQGRPDNQDAVIWTEELTKEFAGESAVDGVTMEIPRGSIFGFIGPSGCGKTTTVRLLLGINRPTSGKAEVLGVSPDHFRSADRQRIGYMPQIFVMYPDLTIRENLDFAASLYGVPLRRHDRFNRVLELVELDGHAGKLARNISGGMRQRLSLASSLVHDPEVIFLDEPTAGIDPILRNKFWEHFKELQSLGRTLFITTQYVGEAAFCDYVGLMSDGQLLMVDTPQGLRHRALGGDVLTIKTNRFLSYEGLNEFRAQPFVSKGQISITRDQAMQIVVEDAGSALPPAIAWLEEQGLEVESASEFNPPMDDVFVMLLNDARENKSRAQTEKQNG